MAYTDAQIQEVCTKASESMKNFSDVQNCTFPTAAIIEGMKAQKTPEEVAEMAFNSVKDLQPTFKDGYNQLAQPNRNPMLNIAQFMSETVRSEIAKIDSQNQDDNDDNDEIEAMDLSDATAEAINEVANGSAIALSDISVTLPGQEAKAANAINSDDDSLVTIAFKTTPETQTVAGTKEITIVITGKEAAVTAGTVTNSPKEIDVEYTVGA